MENYIRILIVSLFMFCGCAGRQEVESLSEMETNKFELVWKKMQTNLIGSWIAKTQTGGAIKATYKLISNGTALVETYVTPSGRETITIYHPDGKSLMLTHYCAQGNQARLKAVDSSSDMIIYRYIDATNVKSDQAVLNELDIQFRIDGFDRTDVYRNPSGETESTKLHFIRGI